MISDQDVLTQTCQAVVDKQQNIWPLNDAFILSNTITPYLKKISLRESFSPFFHMGSYL